MIPAAGGAANAGVGLRHREEIAMGVRLSMFATDQNTRAYEPGEAIFNAFDMGSEMYIVVDGEVELTIDSKVLEVIGPGQPFGEMALIDQAPAFALEIMKVMADRLRKMNARV